MKRVATIILNRNLPEVTNNLVEHIKHYDKSSDVFVVEAGSDRGNLSKYSTWYADWPEAMQNGLRYSRGMNFGLSELWKSGDFRLYDAFFLLTNDTELEAAETIKPLLDVFEAHPRVGILSPCSRRWGEKSLLKDQLTKYFWFIHNNAYMLRRELIEDVLDSERPNAQDFLFDGTNFRGYGAESEIIAKAYANDWAAAITASVWAGENESYLIEKSDLIKTEAYDENVKLYVKEGLSWMRRKYGFNSHWSMQQYVKSFYDNFFEFHPEYSHYKI